MKLSLFPIAFLVCQCIVGVHGEGSALSFLLLGDWGKGGTTGAYGSSLNDDEFQNSMAPQGVASSNNNNNNNNNKNNNNKNNKVFYQVQVAKAMGQYAASASPAPSFVLALGDNFYNNGVSSSTDKLWDYLWKDVYLGYESLRIPWHPVFGNHDYGGGASAVQAQLQRSAEHTDDDIWQFPAANYSKRFAIPGGLNATVQIVFVDTTTLAPSVNKCCNENGGVSQEEQFARIENQLRHITAALEEAKSDPPTWLLVAGHYPVFSAGGNGDTSELQKYLLPLLREYRVHAYVCGHDHISEHLQDGGVEFFVAGAGSMADKLGAGSAAERLVWYGVGYSAFAHMTATASSLRIGFVNLNGTAVYSYVLSNPNPLPYLPIVSPPPVPEPDPPVPPDTPSEPNTDDHEEHQEHGGIPVHDRVIGFASEKSALLSLGLAMFGFFGVGVMACFLKWKDRKRIKYASVAKPVENAVSRFGDKPVYPSDHSNSSYQKTTRNVYLHLLEEAAADDVEEDDKQLDIEEGRKGLSQLCVETASSTPMSITNLPISDNRGYDLTSYYSPRLDRPYPEFPDDEDEFQQTLNSLRRSRRLGLVGTLMTSGTSSSTNSRSSSPIEEAARDAVLLQSTGDGGHRPASFSLLSSTSIADVRTEDSGEILKIMRIESPIPKRVTMHRKSQTTEF